MLKEESPMHVAICDDNVADRKHLERLLSRESDKRAGTPNILYIDSYGHKDHFLNTNPLMYDIIFMDMGETPNLAEEIIHELTEMGQKAPIILFSSKTDYTLIPGLPENVVHRQKPYNAEQLPELLALGDNHADNYIKKFKFHINGEISYIPVNDVMYFMPAGNSCSLYMQNDTVINIDESFGDFQHISEPYKEFTLIGQKVSINIKYATKFSPFSVMMADYRKFRCSPFLASQLMLLADEIREEG